MDFNRPYRRRQIGLVRAVACAATRAAAMSEGR